MSSVKNFKKELNQVLSEIIEECYVSQLKGDDKTYAKADKIIDEAITTFDDLIARLHQKPEGAAKAHFQALRKELQERTDKLSAQIDKLNT